MADQPPNDFYTTLPVWAKLLLQLGFAGLMAVLFFLSSRDQAAQLREMQTETRVQAREDRQLFRDSLREQRDTIAFHAQVLATAVSEIHSAITKLDTGQQQLKKEVVELKNPFPSPREK